jgi:hypothetical protein
MWFRKNKSDISSVLRLVRGQSDVLYTLLRKGFVEYGSFKKNFNVSLDMSGVLTFRINESWWDGLSDDDKTFFLCREGLRLMDRHGLRKPDGLSKSRVGLWDLASDLVLNRRLGEFYSVFRPEGEIVAREIGYAGFNTVEGVYEFLCEVADNSEGEGEGEGEGESSEGDPGKGSGSGSSDERMNGDGDKPEQPEQQGKGDSNKEDNEEPNEEQDSEGSGENDSDNDDDDSDDSNEPEDADQEIDPAQLDKLLVQVTKNANTTEEEIKQIAPTQPKGQKGGTEKTDLIVIVKQKHVPPKQKWAEVVHYFAMKGLKETITDTMAVNPYNLNYVLDQVSGRLPGRLRGTAKVEAKVPVVFLMDVSGSCAHYFDRFMTAAQSLPLDKFEPKFYAFNTEIWPVEMGGKSYLGGGTSFQQCFDVAEKFFEESAGSIAFWLTDMENYDRTVGANFQGCRVNPDFNGRHFFFLVEGAEKANVMEGSTKLFLREFE